VIFEFPAGATGAMRCVLWRITPDFLNARKHLG